MNNNYAQMVQHNEHVIVIRDTQTVQTLQRRLASSRRMLVIGNGGIATELVYVDVTSLLHEQRVNCADIMCAILNVYGW